MTTSEDHGTRQSTRVKTYGDVLREYEFHPESKCANSNGEVCTKQTIGLLQRRHVRIEKLTYIGKESNRLEDVESGLVHSQLSVYTEYAAHDGMNGKRRLCLHSREFRSESSKS